MTEQPEKLKNSFLLAQFQKIYAARVQPQKLDLSLLLTSLQRWSHAYPDYDFLHPCLIDGRASLVCQATLSCLSPEAYQGLSNIAGQFGLFLKEDQRQSSKRFSQNRRSRKIWVFGFCLSLVSASVFSRNMDVSSSDLVQPAEVQGSVHSHRLSAHISHQKGRSRIHIGHIKPPSVEFVLQSFQAKKSLLKADGKAIYAIEKFLRRVYQPKKGDPVYLRSDLRKIAQYYGRYSQVVELIHELEQKNVKLEYKKSHWQAQAEGTAFTVDSVTVYFDTRMGAQLWQEQRCKGNPACHISPADALLHELLHARLMIVKTDEFIKNGGMQPTLYLFDHEKQVIAMENQLYRSMTQADGLFRPLRNRHTGRLLRVSCALCFPFK